MLQSAHVSTYGERAVDTFYVTDRGGDKIVGKAKLARVEALLLDAARAPGDRRGDGDDRRAV